MKRERYARIHPLQIPALCSCFVSSLAADMNIESTHRLFSPLRAVQTQADLDCFDWESLGEEIQVATSVPTDQVREALADIRFFAERSVLHRELYCARSGTTLKILGQCSLPPCLPQELARLRCEFEKHLQAADQALRTGRARLDYLQQRVLAGDSPWTLKAVLTIAACMSDTYQQEINAAYEVANRVNWYLSWVDKAQNNSTLQEHESRSPAA